MGVRFKCPKCNHKLHVKSELAGKSGVCPHCSGRIVIPKLESATPTEHEKTPAPQTSPPTPGDSPVSLSPGADSPLVVPTAQLVRAATGPVATAAPVTIPMLATVRAVPDPAGAPPMPVAAPVAVPWKVAEASTSSPRPAYRYRRRSNTAALVVTVLLLLALIPLSYFVIQVVSKQWPDRQAQSHGEAMDDSAEAPNSD
jgi:DNA-directed RNA polymerase subunit RPC12/RpoP